jgi:hypothetical protein
MCKRLIYVMMFVLALGSTAHAGVYLWNGSAGDLNWDTALNWTVTDSAWTWPNEEFSDKMVNDDTLGIDILNGDAVSRGSELAIQGAADGSTTGVLTLDNGSSLTVEGRLAIGGSNNTLGQIDILGGSTLTIAGEGNDLKVVDNDNTWGTLNIIDSTVDIIDDLAIDQGEGYVNISGSSTLNADDFLIADANTAVCYVDISGTTVITIVDDFTIDEGIGTVTIGGDAVINFGDDCYIPDVSGQGTMTLTGNSVFNVGDDMTIADDADTVGHVIVTGNATLNAPDELYIADANTAFGTLDINGTATVNIGDDLNIGEDGPGICNIGENATLDIVDDIYVAHNSAEGVFESYMTISGNATVTCQDLIVANNGGLTGYLHISGNPTIHTTANFYMNDDEGDPAYSEVIMDGGTVTVDGYTTFNDDVNGTAEFIMNGGSFYSADYLNLSDNLDGTAHLTMNGGEMITGNRLRLGKDGGEDTGQVRIFMNGGLLQAEELSDIMITDTKIIYTGGEFRIGSASLDEAGMQQLITDGTIVAEGAYIIVTDGDYTALITPEPVNPGTEGLIAYYAFENNANDSSDNGLHGTIVGDPVFVEGPAGYGMALDFDGDGDYVDCGNSPLFDVTEQISVAAWVNIRSVPGEWRAVIAKGDNAWRISTNSSTQGLHFGFEDGSRGWQAANSDTVLPLNEWHHVCGTYDLENGGRIYIDGALDGTNPDTEGITLDTYNVYIGDNSQNTGRFWDGLIDEVAIYDRALSELEVLYLAGGRATPVNPGSDGLVAYYPLENDVLDASGNGYDGTIAGDPAFVEGAVGMALEFDGDDHVDTGYTEDLADWTISAWAMSPAAPSGDSPSGPVHREINYQFNWNHGDDTFRGAAALRVGGTWYAAKYAPLEADTWYHLTATYDGDSLKAYRDGELITDNTDLSGDPDTEAATLKLGRHATAEQYFTGTVDEAMIYNRVLSTGEVRYLAGFRAMTDPGTDALIAYYPLDIDALDASGNGNDGTINGDPNFVEGMVGMAMEFDGDGDFVDCGNAPILALTDAVSISAWIKVAVQGADHKVGGNQDSVNGGYKMSVYNDKVEFEIRTSSNSAVLNRSVAGGTVLEVDVWYHVAGVYSLADGYIRTYINGELDRELETTDALGASPGPLMIGCEPFSTGQYNFNGVMDDIRVYNEALSEAEVRYLANN